ncbi:topoisomerase DNA-binding C4 zinc finger domain-containing protein [Thalassobacillus sp. B23F22_16]|uniref:topoisomerase DNA-binding C4 zinc finger domain-containing protein n=1 Tax=Thalassobacillus sp. B23F22_16 TaxID=3459513 RepID=UPI00373ED562
MIDFINKISPNIKPETIRQTIEPKTRRCPSCNGTLTVRYSKQGNSFMGCSNYPTCKHTENIAK